MLYHMIPVGSEVTVQRSGCTIVAKKREGGGAKILRTACAPDAQRPYSVKIEPNENITRYTIEA